MRRTVAGHLALLQRGDPCSAGRKGFLLCPVELLQRLGSRVRALAGTVQHPQTKVPGTGDPPRKRRGQGTPTLGSERAAGAVCTLEDNVG